MKSGRSFGSRFPEAAAGSFLPLAVFLLILFRFGILPFGGTTLLFSDLDSQYIEFMAEYRRILLGQGSLFYSWNAGIGMNFLALAAYYLASPFNFLLALFPENDLPLAVSLITALKIACAGGAFGLFLRKRYGRNGMIPLFSACYALSAYTLGYAFNIMWLDAVVWLPLLCLETENLLDGKRSGMPLLTLCFALSFVSQFYMSWMTGIFCAFYFLTRLYVRRFSFRDSLRAALRFAFCAGTAAGLSAFLLVPAFFVLKNNMGLLGQEFPPAGGNFPFYTVFAKAWPGSFDGIKDCLPHIYCGISALTGLILFFLKKEIPGRDKAAGGLMTALLLFSFWFRPLDFLWHAMDHPSWFPFRYAFLFSFQALGCACEAFREGPGKRDLLTASALCLIPFGIFAAAARPGLPVLAADLLLLVLYPLALILFPRKIRTAGFTLLCCAELLMNGCMTLGTFADGYTRLEDYRSFQTKYRSLAEPLLPRDGEFYRMEKTALRNYNDPLGIGYPGVSHFSSTASARQSEFLKRLGFNCYATWCTYQGATQATDAMLRIRYEFGEAGKADSAAAGADVWEHPAQFPLFFFADEAFARYDFFAEDVNAVRRQDDLLRLLEGPGAEPFFTELPVEIVRLENLEKDTGLNYRRIDPEKPAWIDARVTKAPGRSVYLSVPGASLNYTVTVGNEREVISAKRDFAPFPVCLDGSGGEDAVDVRVETMTGTLENGIFAYALDTDRLLALSGRLSEDAPSAEKLSGTEFLLRTDASDRERWVVSSIPFDGGWHVSADGKDLPLKMIHNSVLGFILPEGCDTVRVRFRPYGWETGLALSGAALLLWIAMVLFETGGKRRTRA